MRSFEILNTPLIVTTYADLIDVVQARALLAGEVRAIDFTNTHIVAMRRHEPPFQRLTASMDFFIPDGMPLIWCLNARGANLRDRVYGPTFMRRCMISTPSPRTHYLLGGSIDTLELLQRKLREQQAALQIVGSHHGFFSADDNDTIIDEINRLSPDFIWVGLGTPKQQAWIHHNKSRIHRGVIFAVGFAFDVNAGTKRDAPDWMQRLGLTWLFRIATEPRRLLTRYLKWNSLFVFYLIKDALFPAQKQPKNT